MKNSENILKKTLILIFSINFLLPQYFLLWKKPVFADQTVYNTAGSDTFNVPSGVSEITVKTWGGGGGGGAGGSNGNGGNGGGAGFAQATLSVTPEETLDIHVGGGGGGGTYDGSYSGGGGGGGGTSYIERSGSKLIIAAGGGGGGGGDNSSSTAGGTGGPGGGTSGTAGGNSSNAGGGGGGTSSAGGSGGADGSHNDGSDGASLTGGAGADGRSGQGADGSENNGGTTNGGDGGEASADGAGYAGGGGGGCGYYGGGGGGCSDANDAGGGGGGGGSSYTTGSDTSTSSGSGTSAGNNGDSDYADSAGQGGSGGGSSSAGSSGNDGRIVINYISNSNPSAPTSLETEGSTNPTQITDTTPEFTAIYNDPDTGDVADDYQIQVDDNSDFSSTYWDSTKTGMSNCTEGNRCSEISYSGSALSRGTTYYWRIKFWDDDDAEGAWSTGGDDTFKLNQLPDTPTNSSPADSATNQSVNPTLESSAFSDSDGGDTHAASQWQISDTDDTYNGNTVWDSGEDASNLTSIAANSTNGTFQNALDGETALAANTTYYWRVRHKDSIGEWSSWSTDTSFTTTQAPTAPTSLETEGETNPTQITDTTPEFTAVHNDPDGDSADYYQIQVDDDSGFGSTIWDSSKSSISTVSDGTRSSDITYAGSDLTRGTIYYWRIKFWDTLGAEGAWSTGADDTFTLNQLPDTPTNSSPSDSANDVDLGPTLESSAFSDSDGGDTHAASQWQISDTDDTYNGNTVWDSGEDASNLTSIVVNSSNGTFQNALSGESFLAGNTTYYWHVRHKDDEGEWSSWSSDTSFTTAEFNLTCYCYLEEAGNDSQIVVKWTDYNDHEDGYEIERNVNAGGFADLTTEAANTTSYTDTDISQNNTYQYRISATSGAGHSTWCTTATLDLSQSDVHFEGVNFQGVNLD